MNSARGAHVVKPPVIMQWRTVSALGAAEKMHPVEQSMFRGHAPASSAAEGDEAQLVVAINVSANGMSALTMNNSSVFAQSGVPL